MKKLTSRMSVKFLPSFLFFFLCFSMTSCFNIFDPLDEPTGDEQILSAARACFDEGDLDCAKDWYQQLSDGQKDVKNSELAFAILDGAGAGMGLFIQAFGDGAADGLGTLADLLAGGANESRRTTIFEAYKKVQDIENIALKGFVRFVTAMTFAAHLLAESHDANGVTGFSGDDFVQNASNCKDTQLSGCASTDCNKAGDLSDSPTPSSSDTMLDNSTTVSGTGTLQLFHKAILSVHQALVEVDAGGKFDIGLGNFISDIQALDGISNATCYRWLIISQGIAS